MRLEKCFIWPVCFGVAVGGRAPLEAQPQADQVQVCVVARCGDRAFTRGLAFKVINAHATRPQTVPHEFYSETRVIPRKLSG